MYLMKPKWEILRMGLTPWDEVDGKTVLKVLEEYGRQCYKSEGKATEESYLPFMKARLSGKIKHTALLDHLHLTAKYICDRGVSHEWLRHKLTEIFGTCPDIQSILTDFKPPAVCQESTRYCNYLKSGGVCFIIPPWITDLREGEYSKKDIIGIGDDVEYTTYRWLTQLWGSEDTYNELLRRGWTPQMARGVLNIAVKTEFIVTCSLTEWRHVMRLRTDGAAHPQMIELMRPQLDEMKAKIPVLFDDIEY